ncbi:MAG: hypothetical protein FJX59_21300 [Alphaproteobacteria bacterium]|nr:hypothetical protein [Alphaproteobacteria bacterium]
MLRFLCATTCLLFAALSATAETLRVGRTAGAPSLGNPFVTVGPPSSGIWLAISDSLTQIGETGAIEPALALSWQAVEPTRWIFKLRPDVRFHNGAPFTAEAVVAELNWLAGDDGRRSYVGGELAGVTGARAIDPLTLEVITARPDPVLPKRFNIVYIVEPSAWRDLGSDGFARAPIGTGPFRLASWGTDRIVMTRTPSWRATPAFDTLEIRIIPDAAVRLQALQSGAIDLMEGLSPDDVDLVDRRRFDVMIKPLPAVQTLAIRNVGNDGAPVQDARVREALNLAIDRAGIAATIAGGERLMVNQGAVEGVIGFDPALPPIAHDPARAKTLLADAGYPDGFDLTIDVMSGYGGNDRAAYEKVAQDLGAIGVRVVLRDIPYTSWLPKYLQNDWGKTDVFSFLWDSGVYYDVIRPIRNSSCVRANPFFCLPELTPLMEASDIEMDDAVRAAQVRQIMGRMREGWGAIWISQTVARVAVRKGVENVRHRSAGIEYERIELGAGWRP